MFKFHRSTYYCWKRRSTGTGWRCCARASGDAEVAEPAARRLSRSGCSPSRSAIPAWAAADRQRPCSGAAGEGSSSAERCLALPAPARPEYPRQTALARRWLRAPYEPPRQPEPEPHVEVERPGELVGMDCFYVGRLSGTKGSVWQLTAIDVPSSFAWTELVGCPGQPERGADLEARGRVAPTSRPAGGSSASSATTGRVPRPLFRATRAPRRPPHPDPRRPPPDQRPVEALHQTILEECWRPAFARYLHPRFTGLRRDLERYLAFYNHDRAHHGRLTSGRIPADIVYGARKMESR